jgi:hypothetical protein
MLPRIKRLFRCYDLDLENTAAAFGRSFAGFIVIAISPHLVDVRFA